MSRDAPLVQAARRACEAARHPETGSPARQVVTIYVFADGTYAVASYGVTKAECAAIRPTCDAIADAIEEDGDLASFCPECGPNVPTDEDGCCGACGAVATGTAIDEMAKSRIRLPVARVNPCYAGLDGDPRPCGLPDGHTGGHRP